MSELFEDVILDLTPGVQPEPEMAQRLRDLSVRRDAEVKRALGEMEKGNYEIVDLEHDEY